MVFSMRHEFCFSLSLFVSFFFCERKNRGNIIIGRK